MILTEKGNVGQSLWGPKKTRGKRMVPLGNGFPETKKSKQKKGDVHYFETFCWKQIRLSWEMWLAKNNSIFFFSELWSTIQYFFMCKNYHWKTIFKLLFCIGFTAVVYQTFIGFNLTRNGWKVSWFPISNVRAIDAGTYSHISLHNVHIIWPQSSLSHPL